MRFAAQTAVSLAHCSKSRIIGVVVGIEPTEVIILVSGGLMPDILAHLVVSLRLVVIVRFLQLLDLFVDIVDQDVPELSDLIFVSTEGNV